MRRTGTMTGPRSPAARTDLTVAHDEQGCFAKGVATARRPIAFAILSRAGFCLASGACRTICLRKWLSKP